jgi:hypothetical protein
MAKNNAKAPKPSVPGRNGSSNSDDKMASKTSASFAVRSDKGTPGQYAADEAVSALMGDAR